MKQRQRVAAGLLLMGALALSTTALGQVEEAVEASPITAVEVIRSARSWDGHLLPAYPDGQPEVVIRRITIQPGARLETHRHPVINAGVVIAGELTVVAASGQTLYLKPGDPIVELVDSPHYGINEGSVPVDIIVFYAGVTGSTLSVTEPK